MSSLLRMVAVLLRIVWILGMGTRVTLGMALARRRSRDPQRLAARERRIRRDTARRACALLRLRVEVAGRPPRRGPLLIATNHLGYLDILAWLAVAPARFVAKSEVARWPLIGWLATSWGTIYVERGHRGAGVPAFVETLRGALADGVQLVVFPEGTSTDGTEVRPFKTGAFGAVELDGRVPVLPVHLDIVAIGGAPPTKDGRASVAWFGEGTLVGHMVRFARTGGARLRLTFGEPIDTTGLGRHELAQQAREAVLALAARERGDAYATPEPEPRRRRLARALRRAAHAPALFRGRPRAT